MNAFHSSWFFWAVGIAVGLPIVLIALTELYDLLVRRQHRMARQVSLLRNYVVPLGALLLLLPFALAVIFLSFPYVARSWAILEGSRETSGLPAVFLLKTLIPLFAAMLALQGIAPALRAALVLAGVDRMPAR